MFFSNLNYNCSDLIWETSRNKLKKHFVTNNFSDLSLFQQIVLVISKFLQILGLQPRISKVFLGDLEQFFLTVGQNNFWNKIPIFCLEIYNFEAKIEDKIDSRNKW